jgi:hypothetical protein
MLYAVDVTRMATGKRLHLDLEKNKASLLHHSIYRSRKDL